MASGDGALPVFLALQHIKSTSGCFENLTASVFQRASVAFLKSANPTVTVFSHTASVLQLNTYFTMLVITVAAEEQMWVVFFFVFFAASEVGRRGRRLAAASERRRDCSSPEK